MSDSSVPPGFQLRLTLRGHMAQVNDIAWSPTRNILASCSDDGSIRLWQIGSGEVLHSLKGHTAAVKSVAWSSDGTLLASASSDRTVRVWDATTGETRQILQHQKSAILAVTWSPLGHLVASGSYDSGICVWDADWGVLRRILNGHMDQVKSLAWAPDGSSLASGADDKTVRLWTVPGPTNKDEPFFDSSRSWALGRPFRHDNLVSAVAWQPGTNLLATASSDRLVRLWDMTSQQLVRVLEGHTSRVTDISFSGDGRFLASVSTDGTMRFWRSGSWDAAAILGDRTHSRWFSSCLSFSLRANVFAATGGEAGKIELWEYEPSVLEQTIATKTIRYSNAKIVLVGESNVGKSCLALRLAENRYEEQGTTHGMRFWPMTPEHLSAGIVVPASERREVVLWDLGGQDEYRLVHQLFLSDTTVALVLLDPTRGRAAFDEVVSWNQRLEKQLRGHSTTKILIGTKLDVASSLVDTLSISQLVRDCHFVEYLGTSAKTDRGIAALRERLAAAIDWDMLATTSRPLLFQHIRDIVERRRSSGTVTLAVVDLERQVRQELPTEFDADAVSAVVDQLAAQGVLVDARLASRTRVLILQIGEIERYAGSLILFARNNPRGLPAIEVQQIVSSTLSFPGINPEERLQRKDELTVLECVVQLLVEHGICLRHEGLLIFPALFRPTEASVPGSFPHAVSLYYDFSGAIDNVYSSLVASLVYSERFGRMRLWEDRAEFEQVGTGVCGLRKVERKSGFAHLDVYFDSHSPQATRDLFLSFVDEHLRQQGVDIYEHLEITCTCGFVFDEDTVRIRIADNKTDILCPRCERRTQVSEGAKTARERNQELTIETWALRTRVEERARREAQRATQSLAQAQPPKQSKKAKRSQLPLPPPPLRILHLSDLHFSDNEDVESVLQPLIADICDREEGLGSEILDYLVITGDLASSGKSAQFDQARKFISGLIRRFQLTAARCIITPGNHDLDWDEAVYHWKGRRPNDTDDLTDGCYIQQDRVLGVRDDDLYPNRLKNFSEHFYHPLIQEPYPLQASEQGLAFLYAETGLQFLAMNSAWETDEYFPDRASVHRGAMARMLARADEQVKLARDDQRIGNSRSLLRIALWHHPVRGPEQLKDDAFLEQLKKAGVRVCLHGHVHEERADLVGHLDARSELHIVGAGSFGAPASARPESVPRLYNLIEVTRDLSRLRVHTRCLVKDPSAWKGWAVWPMPGNSLAKQTYYEIDLRRSRG